MNGSKALIVDDSRLAQFVLKKMLLDQDLQVDISSSAEDALTYLNSNKPDLIFLDHTMPGMNGLEVLKVLKSHEDTASIPVMMYTSQEDGGYMEQARKLGALEVLPKQLKPSELVEALQRLNLTNKNKPTFEPESNASNLATATIFEKNKEELETLVYNAEVALGHETAQQRLQQKLEKQQGVFDKKIIALNNKISNLVPQTEETNTRHVFWNNVLWGAIYCATIIIFGSLYIQQQNQIQTLAKNQNLQAERQANIIAENLSQDLSSETQTDNDFIGNENSTEPLSLSSIPQTENNTNIQTELLNLEAIFNNNNQVPYDELLLGDTAQANLTELLPTLEQLNFSGRVTVLAHDGSFCLKTNTNGQLELAEEDLPMGQCQMSEPNSRLADIASIGLLQLITSNNEASDSNFTITLNPLAASSPIQEYPDIDEDILAGEWNDIASNNRRTEIKLFQE